MPVDGQRGAARNGPRRTPAVTVSTAGYGEEGSGRAKPPPGWSPSLPLPFPDDRGRNPGRGFLERCQAGRPALRPSTYRPAGVAIAEMVLPSERFFVYDRS